MGWGSGVETLLVHVVFFKPCRSAWMNTSAIENADDHKKCKSRHLKKQKKQKDLREGVEHAEDHPDVNHLGVGGGRQGAGEPDKAVR